MTDLSSQPPPSRRHDARGSLREALSALRNLEQLLKSLRVGPKALSSVIPDVRISCADLTSTIRELLAPLAAPPIAHGQSQELQAVAQELLAFATSRTEILARALAYPEDTPMSAKWRLGLEYQVALHTAELEALAAIAQCLGDGLAPRPLLVDLNQLAQQALALASDGTGPKVHVELSLKSPSCELWVQPNLVSECVLLAASWASEGAQRPIALEVAQNGAGEPCLSISQLQSVSPSAQVVALHLAIPPLLSSLRASAALLGASFSVNEAGCVLCWPSPAQTSQPAPAPDAG